MSPLARLLEEPAEEPKKQSAGHAMQFTEKQIQALKPKAQRYDIREKSGDGFAIRVSEAGEKSWIFFYTFEGKKRRMTFGRYPEMTLAQARNEHRKALTTLVNGKDPGRTKQTEKLAARVAVTVEDLIEEYLEKWAKPRKRSWQEDQRILYKDVKPNWGKRKAKDITRRDLILLLDKIKERGAPIAANRTLSCVRRMFNFAIERDIIPTSPCTSIKAPAKENRKDRFLSLEEIKDFWHSLENAAMSEGTKLALKLQLVTAQRKGEIVNAEWNEIDLTSGWWTIPAEKAKNGQPHQVPLSKVAIQLLNEIKICSNGSRWLFPSIKDDKPIHGDSVDHAVRRSVHAFTNLKTFSPHDLRRTAASQMTAMGINRLTVSKILNHAENSVTSIYDRHSYDQEKRYALEAWGKKLNELTTNLISAGINVICLKTSINQKEFSLKVLGKT